MEAVERAEETGQWESYVVTAHGLPISVRVRLISKEDSFDAVSVLVIVDEKYATVGRTAE